MVNPATSAEWRASVSDSVKGGMGPGGGGKHRRPSYPAEETQLHNSRAVTHQSNHNPTPSRAALSGSGLMHIHMLRGPTRGKGGRGEGEGRRGRQG